MNFYEWQQYGIDKGWISPQYCMTHDGGYEYLSVEDQQEMDEGGDPCQVVHSILFEIPWFDRENLDAETSDSPNP